ncbi:MAG: chromosomal replication initiator protein DnaA [Pseudomonadota bacterium]
METRGGDPIWEQALELISQQVNEGTYRIWFEPTVGMGLTDGTYSVGVASDFAKDWIDTRFRALISEAVSQVVGEPVRFHIVVSPSLSHAAALEDQARTQSASAPDRLPSRVRDPAAAGVPLFPRTNRGQAGHRPVVASHSTSLSQTVEAMPAAAGLMGKYTFDTFVIGQSNRFAHAAALAAAETPGTQYNPLFIYGGVGLGKTHLLHAIGNYALRNHPGRKVRYVTLETFTNDFINSLRDDSIEGFKNRYRTIDVLLIDDIQFLQKKEQTQEEFFHTFNALYDAQKQIVITSDRHPKGLATLEDRLVSRFEWGLITDIQPPDLETRVAILRKKVRSDGIILDDDVLMLIASRVPTNIRELEGCLTRVVAFSSFTKHPIDVALAREVLKDIPETPSTRITIDLILSSVAESTGISVTEITGDKRSRPVVESRHLAMYLARELTDASLPKIGERIGNRDHTTVLHAVEKIAKLMREDREMYNRVQRLTSKVKSAR